MASSSKAKKKMTRTTKATAAALLAVAVSLLLAAQLFLSLQLELKSSNGSGFSREKISSGLYQISGRLARDLVEYARGGGGGSGDSSSGGRRSFVAGSVLASSATSDAPWWLSYNHTFPRWGRSSSAENGEDFEKEERGIDITAVISYIRELGRDPSRRIIVEPSSPFTEIPVSFSPEGVHLSLALRNRIPKKQIRHRIFPVQRALFRAWLHFRQVVEAVSVLESDPGLFRDPPNGTSSGTKEDPLAMNAEAALSRWPSLIPAFRDGGFPFVLFEGDYRSCNYRNYRVPPENNNKSNNHPKRTARMASVPIFTTCARVNCTHAFPFPSYEFLSEIKPLERDWRNIFHVNHLRYPWHSKIRKLVWRGGLTGPIERYSSPRARIALFAAEHRGHPLLDVGLHSIPERHWPNRTARPRQAGASGQGGGLRGGRRRYAVNLTALLGANNGSLAEFIPKENFASYVAILDTDGNSWSSRFGRLLCTNSLVIKVEPQYVDHFYRYLVPWKHYVPVQYDLSDLLRRVEWAMDPSNVGTVRRIVMDANRFCQERMVYGSVTDDILDIFEAYVKQLSRHDPHWQRKWTMYRQRELFSPSSGYQMQNVTGIKCRYTLHEECYIPKESAIQRSPKGHVEER
jgi:hypothetical protein